VSKTHSKARRWRTNIKVIVRIDYDALRRGWAEGDEVCEIDGLGPVPVAAARALLDDAFVAAVLTKGTDIRKVVHLGRRPTALQQTALQWRDPTCAVDGCPNRLGLEIDHNTGWCHTHTTELDDLAPLCHHHHWLKTYEGWRLEPGPGPRRLLPPGHSAQTRGSVAANAP
jgi:hypothetical protein